MLTFIKRIMARIACALPLKFSAIKAAINSAYTKLSECVNGSTDIDKSLAFPMSRFKCWTNMQASQGDASYLNKSDTVGTITWASQLTNNTVGLGPTTMRFSLWRNGVKIQDVTMQHPEGVFKQTFALDYAREAGDFGLTLKSEPSAGSYFLWTDTNGQPSQMSQTVLAKVAAPAQPTVPTLGIRRKYLGENINEVTYAYEVYCSTAVASAMSGNVQQAIDGSTYPNEPFTIAAGALFDEAFRKTYVMKFSEQTVTVTLLPSADGSYNVGAASSVTVTVPVAS